MNDRFRIMTVGLGLLILASALNTFVNLNSSWAKGKVGNDVNTVIGSTSNVKINSGGGNDLIDSSADRSDDKSTVVNSGGGDDSIYTIGNTGTVKVNCGGEDSVSLDGSTAKVSKNCENVIP